MAAISLGVALISTQLLPTASIAAPVLAIAVR